jgi:SAM-dependent methyltransferase
LNSVVWHEVECGAYTADLTLWEEMADQTDKPIMELGCGAGRVTLHLAHRGAYLVIGLDWDSDLVAAVWERSGKIPGDAELADVRSFEFATKFSLVIAPMQLIQLLPTSNDRIECLSCVVNNMLPGGRAAFAIVEEMPYLPPGAAAPPLPDVRQIEGWIYSSLPLQPIVGPETILLRRLRQTVDPDGNMSEEMNEIESTEEHVGSTVVLFDKEA